MLQLPRNVSIRFYEKKGGAVVWEEYVEEEQLKVHYQTAIAFKPPMYHNLNITEPVKVFLELFQTCDKTSSKALPFEYLPLETGMFNFYYLFVTFNKYSFKAQKGKKGKCQATISTCRKRQHKVCILY